MNIKTYTQKAQEAFLDAERRANRAKHAEREPEHLLLALLEQPDGIPEPDRCTELTPFDINENLWEAKA